MYTGADGKKYLLAFVNDLTRKPIVDDLGASDLTKEDFSRVDELIQTNIFSGHQITSPDLFGIAVPGQLGNRQQMRDSYEIFNNTYVRYKQMQIEGVFNMLGQYAGVTEELKLQPVDPIGIDFSESVIKEVAPKEWILEKLGIDPTKYGLPIESEQPMAASPLSVNEHIKGLKGREWQNMQRIIRDFNKGKITREQASSMLKGGYALSDEEVATWLGSEELEFSEDDYKIFYEFGEDREQFEIFKSKTRFSDDDDYQTFADVNQLEANVLDQISKQKNITTDVLADVLKVTIPEIVAILKSLEERNIIKTISKTIGKGDNSNVIIERELVKPLGVTVGAVKPTTTEILIRYSYEWKSGFSNADKRTSRPFCVHLLDAKKMYSRSEIESMSARLGYSVWNRGGGWYTVKGTNIHEPSCRHEWKTNVVKRKK
jgi:DNA-binding MarR family transcriptional regulator